MKYKLLRFTMMALLAMLGGIWNTSAFASETWTYRDFAVQLTNADIFATTNNNFGVKVAEDGTYTATAADDATANFTVKSARFNDSQHGWVNCEFTVPVLGAVKIELGDCLYGGQNGTIVDAAGNSTEIKANATKSCWNANTPHENVVVAYYAGTEATTLTISYNGYCPFIAVTAIDPSEVPSETTVTFTTGEAADAVAPADIKDAIGASITLPKNFTMYVEGKTLTGWSDGTNTYAPGASFTVPAENVTLTPVFTANEVTLADRTEPVTVKFSFRRDEGAPTVGFQNKTGIWVAQATVGGKTIDVKADFDTNNGGKFANGNWSDWAQLNGGTKFTVPSCKGATISMEAYSDITTTTIDGQTDYTSGKTISYTIAGAAETYWGKNKGRSMEGRLVKGTTICVVAFFVLALLLNMKLF